MTYRSLRDAASVLRALQAAYDADVDEQLERPNASDVASSTPPDDTTVVALEEFTCTLDDAVDLAFARLEGQLG